MPKNGRKDNTLNTVKLRQETLLFQETIPRDFLIMGQIWTHLNKCFQQEQNRKRGEEIKAIAIGDRGVGTTCLFIRLRSDDFYDPSCSDDEQNDDVIVSGEFVNLRFWDSDRTESF